MPGPNAQTRTNRQAQPHPHPPTGRTPTKPSLQMDSAVDPSQWLNFSLPPRARQVPGSGGALGVPRRSRRGDGWRGSALTREKFVNASFRFVLKPTETLSYGAHFADPDISLHWPHILQILVPTFSSYSVAQGFVSSDPNTVSHGLLGEEFGRSFDETDLDGMGEEAAERRRRIEEEKQGRSCPICLSKPVAGRMTKCGHIFCFPCILHFIQLSDVPKSAKCPICGDTVHEGMLKSVRYLDAATMIKSAGGDDDDNEATPRATHDVPAPDNSGVFGQMDGFEDSAAIEEARHLDETASTVDAGATTAPDSHRIHMRLIQRPQITTLALPSSPTWPSDAIAPHEAPWHFLPDVLAFSRFMLASPEYMLSELERELGELEAEHELLRGDALGRDFVRAAREKVERQIGKVKNELMTDLVRRNEREARESWGEAVGGERKEKERRRERERKARERAEKEKRNQEVSEVPVEFLAASTPTFAYTSPTVHIPPNVEVEPNPMPSKRNKRRGGGSNLAPAPPATPPPPSYFFYQSSLGANVYLHPLDIRILLAHFKSYSLFPPTIAFSISGYDAGTINDDLRKRCKYLSHLPAGMEVVFVEANLEPIVGKEGLVGFEQPLKARRNKRRDRVRKEDRAKTRWEQAEKERNPTPAMTATEAMRAYQQPYDDSEFALALARSAQEMRPGSFGAGGTSPHFSYAIAQSPHLASSAASSSSGGGFPALEHIPALPPPVTGPSPSSSPSFAPAWPARASFASAVHRSAASTPRRAGTGVGTGERDARVDMGEVDEVWQAFERLPVPSRRDQASGVAGGTGVAREVGEESKSGGKKKGGKAGKKTLVLGGAGRRL